MTLDIEQPIPWETVEAAVADWVATVLDIEIQWADQADPQAQRPFAMISITGPVPIGLADTKTAQEKVNASGQPIDEWEQKSVGQREITISVQVEVDRESSQNPRAHARALATRLQASLTIDSITEPLELAGLAYREVSAVQDFSIVVGAEFVNRSLIEYRAGLASSVVEDISVIEEITGEGTVTGRVDGGSFTVPIDVDSTP